MTTTNRTKKRSPDEDDFQVLRDYILACPTIANPKENAAVKAALAGLESELKRRERDAKLQKKFAAGSAVEGKAAESSVTRQDLVDDSEWQDLADDRKSTNNPSDRASPTTEGDETLEFVDMDRETSFLGKKLAEHAIQALAESGTRAKTPLAAMAAVLHGMLISSPINFACTGTAHDKDQAKSAGGFAAPIRELPKGHFLPKDWDRYASKKSNDDAQQQVVLRYRKQGTGAVLLRVEFSEEAGGPGSSSSKDISVKLLPAKTKEPPSESLVFPLEDHINLQSWNAALRAAAALEPAIHYKQLPVLMTNFAKTFDLGDLASSDDNKNDSEGPATAFIGVHSTEKCSTEAKKRSQEFARPIFVENGQAHSGYLRPTIDGAFPTRPMFVGDFSGDLVPGGLDPLRRTGPDGTGSLMGPNHPMFQGGGGGIGMGGVGDGSGLGMRPRFDPFGPPGGPQEIQPPAGPGGLPPHLRPRGSGEPNKDHLRPPNSLGNNMFC